MRNLAGGVLIQLSTYSANGNNSQKDVLPSVDAIMEVERFKRYAKVRVDGNMMSLVYGRDVSRSDELKDLGDRFNEWLKKSKSPI